MMKILNKVLPHTTKKIQSDKKKSDSEHPSLCHLGFESNPISISVNYNKKKLKISRIWPALRLLR